MAYNPNLILVLKTSKDCEEFRKKYKTEDDSLSFIFFNFKKVSQDFAGLDFQVDCPFNYFSSKNYGVIWNPNIIQDLELMLKTTIPYPSFDSINFIN